MKHFENKMSVFKEFWLCFLYFSCIKAQRHNNEHTVMAELPWDPVQQMCPGLDDKILTYIHVPWGVPGRAYLTVPPEVQIAPSTIPGAGLGAIATTFIPKYTWLGSYDGYTIVSDEWRHISPYAWTTSRGFKELRFIEAKDLETSNWLRWVTSPRNVFEENVWIRECFDKVYYITSKDIVPGEELFVFYGKYYAKTLNNWTEYKLSKVLRDTGRKINARKDLRKISSVLKELMLIKDDKSTKTLKTVMSDNVNMLSELIGPNLFFALLRSESLNELEEEEEDY